MKCMMFIEKFEQICISLCGAGQLGDGSNRGVSEEQRQAIEKLLKTHKHSKKKKKERDKEKQKKDKARKYEKKSKSSKKEGKKKSSKRKERQSENSVESDLDGSE